jgi:hypothetical protein
MQNIGFINLTTEYRRTDNLRTGFLTNEVKVPSIGKRRKICHVRP